MTKPACPICGSIEFADFNGRRGIRCESCGSLERGRYQWLVLQRRVALKPGAVVAHFAPEAFFMDHFAGLPGVTYLAYDKFPQHYRHDRVVVRELDLCTDRDKLKSSACDLVIHSHVLEHLPCAFAPVLADMKRMLKPGGMMLFSVPIDADVSSEGVDPAQNETEVELRARQGDHMRIFGKSDFPAIVADILGAECLVRQSDLFSEAELLAANIPVARKGEPTGKSVFLYTKT
jgi:SAM-dependent methyltransferase